MLILLLALFATPVAAADLQAVVTTRIVYPGEVIGAGDLRVVTVRNRNPVHKPVVRDVERALGHVATRTLLPRRYIPLAVLKRADMVKSGQMVNAIYNAGTLAISLRAVALGGAAMGERVALRTLSGNAMIHGIVAADGTVRVSR